MLYSTLCTKGEVGVCETLHLESMKHCLAGGELPERRAPGAVASQRLSMPQAVPWQRNIEMAKIKKL